MKKLSILVLMAVFMMSMVSAATYMKVGDTKDESKSDGYLAWSEVDSFEFGVANQPSDINAGKERNAGKPQFTELSVKKKFSMASADFYTHAAKGILIPEVILVKTMGSSDEQYLEIKLTDVLITSVLTSITGDEMNEAMTLNYAKIEMSVFPLKDNGKQVETPKKFTYNLELMKTD